MSYVGKHYSYFFTWFIAYGHFYEGLVQYKKLRGWFVLGEQTEPYQNIS